MIELKVLRRDYPSGDGVFSPLKNIDLQLKLAEYLAIVGAGRVLASRP